MKSNAVLERNRIFFCFLVTPEQVIEKGSSGIFTPKTPLLNISPVPTRSDTEINRACR
jgi:hypothetical protein